MIAGMNKAITVIRMQPIPPMKYQVLTPSQSDTGPAISRLIGIIAVEAAPVRENTLPCISGFTVDWRMALNGPFANACVNPMMALAASNNQNRLAGASPARTPYTNRRKS